MVNKLIVSHINLLSSKKENPNRFDLSVKTVYFFKENNIDQIEKSINGNKITFELSENSLSERKVMDKVLNPKFLIHSDALQPSLSETHLEFYN